jgi:hypothetical protein
MLKLSEMRELVVRPAIRHIGLWSKEAEELVMATAMMESRFVHLSTGLWNITKERYWVVYVEMLEGNNYLMTKTMDYQLPNIDPIDQLPGNHFLGAIICRLYYRMNDDPLPRSVKGMADYWKEHYETFLGKKKSKEFMHQALRMYQYEEIPYSPKQDWRHYPDKQGAYRY